MPDLSIVLIALVAFAGGLAAAVLGWVDSAEPFNRRKFARSVVAALIAGVGFGVGYSLVGNVTGRDVLLAFLSGAGIDVVSNRGIGAVKALAAPPP